jgi:hypothetical protein
MFVVGGEGMVTPFNLQDKIKRQRKGKSNSLSPVAGTHFFSFLAHQDSSYAHSFPYEVLRPLASD